MKRIAIVILFVSTLFLASALHAAPSHKGTGLVRMKHSPTVAFNVTFAVYIDGAKAGVFSRGHVYERSLVPGRHTMIVRRSGRISDSWQGTLDVRPGQTYSFVVKVSPNQVHLVPVTRIE